MPRAGLTPDRVAELGCQVADEVGWDSLTLAAVAQRAGVRLPSLYKHVANAEDLRTRVAVRTVTELHQQVARRCHGLSGRAALGALAHAYRGFARSNPGRYPAVVRAPGEGQAELAGAATALLDAVRSALSGYGLAGDAEVDAVRMVRSATHGFVALETSGGFGMPRDVDRSFDRMVDALDAAVSALADPDRRTGHPAPD